MSDALAYRWQDGAFVPVERFRQQAPGLEVWRLIPSFPAYAASNLGRIRRAAPITGGGGSRRPAGTVLRARALPSGHLLVTLSVQNKIHHRLVHRLVAEAFLPEPEPDLPFVCHKDDRPSNNRPENLYWGSRSDNAADAIANGRTARGERVTSAKLTEEMVRAIRERARSGTSQRAIAAEFGVAQSNVSLIANGKTWGHVL